MSTAQQYGQWYLGEDTWQSRSVKSLFVEEDGLLIGVRVYIDSVYYSMLSKKDYEGNYIWSSDLIETSNFQEDVIIRHDDKYVFAGYDGRQIYLFHYGLDGTPIRVDTLTSEDYPEMLVSHLVLYEDQYVLAGQAINTEGTLRSIVYTVSFDGVESQMYVDSISIDIDGLMVDPDGLLTVVRYWEGRVPDQEDRGMLSAEFYSITKYDPNLEAVWSYYPPAANNAPVSLNDLAIDPRTGNMVIMMNQERTTWVDEDQTYRLVMISPNGDVLWEYTWESWDDDNNILKHRVRDLAIMDNGNVIVVGVKERAVVPAQYAWISCYSPMGELLWEREYISNVLSTERQGWGGIAGLSDVAVLNDTTIIVGGNTVRDYVYVESYDGYTNDQDGWILILDEHGCMRPDCAEQIITSTSDVPPVIEIVDLHLSPNPTTGITRLSEPVTGRYEVYSMGGEVLYSASLDHSDEIDLSGVPAGQVAVWVHDTVAQVMRVGKVVVVR